MSTTTTAAPADENGAPCNINILSTYDRVIDVSGCSVGMQFFVGEEALAKIKKANLSMTSSGSVRGDVSYFETGEVDPEKGGCRYQIEQTSGDSRIEATFNKGRTCRTLQIDISERTLSFFKNVVDLTIDDGVLLAELGVEEAPIVGGDADDITNTIYNWRSSFWYALFGGFVAFAVLVVATIFIRRSLRLRKSGDQIARPKAKKGGFSK